MSRLLIYDFEGNGLLEKLTKNYAKRKGLKIYSITEV